MILTQFSSNEKCIRYTVAIDSEFQPFLNKSNQFITVQLEDKIYEHPSLGLNKLDTFLNECALSDYFELKDRQVKLQQNKTTKKLIVELLIYFSPADIAALFKNREPAKEVLNKLEQTNVVKTVDYKEVFTGLEMYDKQGNSRQLYIEIHDLSGYFTKMSLKDLTETLGINFESKDLVNEQEKSKIIDLYKNDIERFKKYALGDTEILKQLKESYERYFEEVTNLLGIDKIKVSNTLGSNVAKIILKMIEKNKKIESSKIPVKYLDEKFSRLNPVERLILSLNQEATAKDLATEAKYTSQYLVLVDGGRCKNERPRNINVKGIIADIDISGCYASGLLNQDYPIGIPVVQKYRKNTENNKLTLGQFLGSMIYQELVGGLWYARISTLKELTFDQDLILSKIPPKKITAESSDNLKQDESEEINGTFILLLREIINGTLTHDLLQILRECSSSKEWDELKEKIVIDCLIFYPSSKQVGNIEELVDCLNKNENKVVNWIDPANLSINEKDSRCRNWLKISFKDDWMDKILGMRKNYPKTDPLNQVFKAIANSTYGSLASSYFDINNVVVASNITARARALAWMMNKALGTYQSITDGGVFNVNRVNSYKGNFPSLNTLTNINDKGKLTKSTKARLLETPLGGYDWIFKRFDDKNQPILENNNLEIENQNLIYIDILAWKHIQNFFQNQEIDILNKQSLRVKGYDTEKQKVLTETVEGQFYFETKNIYKEASFQSQANYRLVEFSEEENFKARGYKLNKILYKDEDGYEIYNNTPPIKNSLQKINNNELVPPYPKLHTPTILKINAWKLSNNKVKANDLLPGDTTTKSTWLRPISLTMFRWKNSKQFHKWNKKNKNFKEDNGYGVEQYFLNDKSELDYVKAVNTIQDAIDQGKNWIINSQNKKPSRHPYLI